jgi:hypothetical protein
VNRQRLLISLLVAVLVVVASYLLGGIGNETPPAAPTGEETG